MISWYLAAQNVVTGRGQLEIQYLPDKVVRLVDGKFPYRPYIVIILCLCHSSPLQASSAYVHALASALKVNPTSDMRYEGQIGLETI